MSQMKVQNRGPSLELRLITRCVRESQSETRPTSCKSPDLRGRGYDVEIPFLNNSANPEG